MARRAPVIVGELRLRPWVRDVPGAARFLIEPGRGFSGTSVLPPTLGLSLAVPPVAPSWTTAEVSLIVPRQLKWYQGLDADGRVTGFFSGSGVNYHGARNAA